MGSELGPKVGLTPLKALVEYPEQGTGDTPGAAEDFWRHPVVRLSRLQLQGVQHQIICYP